MERQMKPIVNTDVKIPKAMLSALSMFETYCVALGKNSTTEDEVKSFLKYTYGDKLANQFREEYLF